MSETVTSVGILSTANTPLIVYIYVLDFGQFMHIVHVNLFKFIILIVDITANGLGYRLCPVTLKIERSEDRRTQNVLRKGSFSVKC